MSFDLPVLPEGWSYVPLESCCQAGSITYGIVQPGAPTDSGVPVVRVNNFRDTHLDLSDVLRVSQDIEAKYGRTRLKGGEVLLTIVGSVGQVAIAPQTIAGFNVARAVAVLDPLPTFPAAWIALCLRSPLSQHLLGSRANTTVQTTINLKDLRALPIPIPPDGERDAIATLIGSLDDRITLLRETNATLEAIAQALFKSWFVDFDPVRAKMAGRAPEGMDEATAALFPDSFEDSALGEVPRGWEPGTIDTLAALNPESWSAKKHPDRIQYVDLANTKANQIDGITEFSFDQAPSRARRVLRVGDVIVGTVRPGNRSFARIAQDIAGLTGSTGFAVLRARHEFDQALVYIAATRDDAIDRLAHLADGGAYPAVRPELVGSTPLVVPPQDLRAAFGEVANPLFAAIGANQEQARGLAHLRDTLLPRLISGQLRLPDAGAQAQALLKDNAGQASPMNPPALGSEPVHAD
ncbi:MAG: restriction endonuclease subunit S [Roseateles asaccharophilus]|uniref:restriction endonuclease subunit S n=1 Tax=Roseateles asaccharophilus TaxID=582607 RepID=UPI00391A79F1